MHRSIILPLPLLLSLLLLLLLSKSATISGQFPFIDPGDASDVGQCISNADCDIYAAQFHVEPGQVQCYQPFMKCISPITGKVLGPAFDIQCPPTIVQISSTVAYPAVVCVATNSGDGIVSVTITANPVQRIKGLVRLYTTVQVPTYNDTAYFANYVQQMYANYPQTVYQFSQLLPNTYTLVYFDISGCYALPVASTLTIVNVAALSTQTVVITNPQCATNGYINTISSISFNATVARALRAYIPLASCTTGAYPSGIIHVGSGSAGIGQRIQVANIYGPDGELLAAYAATDLCLTVSGTGGAAIPIYARNTSYFYPTLMTQAFNAGYMAISVGLGYGYQSSALAPVQYLFYDNGAYRGSFMAPYVVSMTNTSFPPLIGTNPAVQPYFVLMGMFTNTQVMYTTNYFSGFDLTTNPVISILQNTENSTQATFAACYTATSQTSTLTANYLALRPLSGGTTIELRRVINGSLVAFVPPYTYTYTTLQQLPTFTVTTPGLYCLLFIANAFDGYGVRPILYSCFVFGTPTAFLLQTMSTLAVTPYTPLNLPVPYATFLNAVETTFVLGLPVILFAPQDMDPRVTLTLSNTDQLYQAHLQQIGATAFNVFNDQKGSWSLSSYYSVTQVANFNLFVQTVNPETNQVTIETVEGDVSVGEVAMANFQFVNASGYDYFEPSENTQYQCSAPTTLNMLELYEMSVSVTVQAPICPDQLTVLTFYAEGGVCYHMTNPVYLNDTNTTSGGISNPFTMPCGYFVQVQNYDPTSPGYLTVLGAELGLATYNAPTNVVVRVIVYDASSNIAYAIAKGTSDIPINTTMINFVSQELFCDNGTQMENITYEVVTTSVVNVTELITYMVPTNLTTEELYDPNDVYFRLPQDCPLLSNMTAYQVQQYCLSPYGSTTDVCLDWCLNLPPAYPNVIGQSIITGNDGEYWDAVAWVPSGYFNNETGRAVYCRTGNSIRTDVPDALAIQVIGPQLIQINYPPVPCQGSNCYMISVVVLVDYIYEDIVQNISIVANPAFGKNPYAVPPLTANQYTINLGVEYAISVFANGMCPTTQAYTFNVTGPLITNINVFDSICSLNDGSANMILYYYDPDASKTGTEKQLCLYMPNWNGSPLPFSAPINEELYLPTAGLGFDMQQFTPLPPGLTNIWIYEICQTGFNPTPNCLSCVTLPPAGSFAIQPGYIYTFRQFIVPSMASEGGGINIVLNQYIEAPCYGNTYYFSFSIYDDAGPNGQGYPPYVVQFLNPQGVLLKTFGCCVNTVLQPNCTGELPPAQPVGGGRVLIGVFNFTMQTGSQYGFQLSGNYTFVVKSCNSSCVEGYPIYIDIVNPIIINLYSKPSTCNSQNPALQYTVNGGAGFYSSNNALNVTYIDPTTGLIIYSPYILCWITPLNPTHCIEEYLPLYVVPGPYTVCATDRNGCQACQSINVTNVPPVTVQLLGYDSYCETSTYAVATFNISGPSPPYYILEYLDQISNGSIINITLYQNYSKSICFKVMNSVGCITPNLYCFTPPSAGPVIFTVDTTMSCPAPLVPTGTMTVVPSQNYTCKWAASGIPIENYNLCYQTNVPPGVDYIVTVSNYAGCSSQSSTITVAARSPIYMTLLNRTEDGVLHGPCIDYIIVLIGGGSPFAPPYNAIVTNPSPNMTVTILFDNTVIINSVCRGVAYVLSVSASDHQCAVTMVISDPFYDTGGTSPQIPGLTTPNNDFFPSKERNNNGPISAKEAMIIVVAIAAVILIVLVIVVVVITRRRK